MQITNSIVCGASKGSIYNQIKPPLVGEHAFPLKGLFAWQPTLHLVADRSCLTHVFPKSSLGTRLLGGGSNVTVWSTDINRYANYKLGSLWCE